MRSYSVVLFSLLLISSIILVSSVESSFGDKIIATSIGFEDSTILELKNTRGSTVNIDTVRVWLSGENEFKSFKTEKGWMGKNTPQGVIVFTAQNQVNPGEYVKFGIKTIKQNPIINWKAIDANGEVITSASTKITASENENDNLELNRPNILGINDNSVFRLIPERPSSNSDFRVIGENFVPGQSLDFYVGNDFDQTIRTDDDGRVLFTSKTPETQDNERTEFTLRDSGGSEKMISLRILQTESREISEIIKLAIGNTPKEVKRGEIVFLEGMATPSSTLTVTSRDTNGQILDIQTIRVGSNGEWAIEQLVSPEIELGQLGIEVSDGKTKIMRNVDVISPVLINVFTESKIYEKGDTVHFSGKAIAGEKMSIILEDAVGAEIYSRSISVSEAGIVDFEIELTRNSVEGTYVLHLFQGNEEGATIFGVGQEPEAILILRPTKLNYQGNEDVMISIKGSTNAQVSLILIDSADREIFSDTVNLGPDGKELYKISAEGLTSGAYIISGKRGESVDEATFTVGFTTGSGSVIVQTTKSDYKQNEQVLILGNTGSTNVLLDVTIIDPTGEIIKKVETFSNKFGVFKIDNFRIPSDGIAGIWKVSAKSGGNFNETEFSLSGVDNVFIVELMKDSYNVSEIIDIFGSGASGGATVTLKIFDVNGEKIDELNINAKSSGEYSTIWKAPNDTISGDYEIIADDGKQNSSIKFRFN